MGPGSGGKIENMWVAFAGVALVTALRVLFLQKTGDGLLVEESYHWFLASQPAWGYPDSAPLTAWVVHLLGTYCTAGAMCMQLVAPIAIAITALLTYIIARQLCSKRTAFWSALLCVTLPFYTWLGAHLIPATLLVMCFALLVVCEDDATQNNRFISWVGYGIALGLGLMTHYGILFALLATFLYLLSYSDTRSLIIRGLVPAMIVALLVASPHLHWLWEHDFITVRQLSHYFDFHSFSIGGTFQFLYHQLLSFGPIVFIVLFLCFIIRPALGVKNRLMSLFLLPMFYVALILAAFTDISPTWLAMLYVTALPQVVQAMFRQGNDKLVALSLIYAVVVFFGFHVGNVSTLQHRTQKQAYVEYYAPLLDKTYELLAKFNAYVVTDDRTIASALSYLFRDPQSNAPYQVFMLDQTEQPENIFAQRYPFSASLNAKRVALLISPYHDLEEASGQFETIKLLPTSLDKAKQDVYHFYQLIPLER